MQRNLQISVPLIFLLYKVNARKVLLRLLVCVCIMIIYRVCMRVRACMSDCFYLHVLVYFFAQFLSQFRGFPSHLAKMVEAEKGEGGESERDGN